MSAASFETFACAASRCRSASSLLVALACTRRLAPAKLPAAVLNSCCSQDHALAIVQKVEHVVGMTREIGDESAIASVASFCRGLRSSKLSFRYFKQDAHGSSCPVLNTPYAKRWNYIEE